MLSSGIALAVLAVVAPAAYASSPLVSRGIDWQAVTGQSLNDGSHNNPFIKRQSFYCYDPTQIKCPGIDMCHDVGWACCSDGEHQCRLGTTCLDEVENAFWPPSSQTAGIPELEGRDIGCCPSGSNCSDPEWFNDLFHGEGSYTTTASTPTSTGSTMGTTVTLGSRASVLIDLATQVQYTGAWYAYAWAFAWCSVWGSNGQRVDVSSSASVATVQFGPDVKAVSVSMSQSAEAESNWNVEGGSWQETMSGSASAQAGVNSDGSISASASAECTWSKKFTLNPSSSGTTNELKINVPAGTSTSSWCQLNAIKGYASEREMEADISPGEANAASSNSDSPTGSNDTNVPTLPSAATSPRASATSDTAPIALPSIIVRPDTPQADAVAAAPAFALLAGGAIIAFAVMV